MRKNIWCSTARPIKFQINLHKAARSCFVVLLKILSLSSTLFSVRTAGTENRLLSEPLQKSSCHEELIRSAIKWFIKGLDSSHQLCPYNAFDCDALKQRLTNCHYNLISMPHPYPGSSWPLKGRPSNTILLDLYYVLSTVQMWSIELSRYSYFRLLMKRMNTEGVPVRQASDSE